MSDRRRSGRSRSRSPRRKKRGFDSIGADEAEQTGPLVSPAPLPKLDHYQLKALSMAKKYCNDLTRKEDIDKQSKQQYDQMCSLQEAANQQRALMLMCRIYVGSINFELGEEAVRTAFSPFGSIKTINMSWDSATMKHKGYAFLEFETAEGAQMAMEQMNGVLIGGRNIKLGRPNNIPQAAPIIASIQEKAAKYPRIYVASIHPDLSARDVKSVFEAFGHITKIELAPDIVPGQHRGWGFIDYDNHKSAADAIASMNLFDLGGKFLRVGRALTPPLPLFPPNAGPVLPSLLTNAALGISTTPINRKTDPRLCIMGDEVPIPEPPKPKTSSQQSKSSRQTASNDTQLLADIQAKLQTANDEKISSGEVTTLQQEEDVSISGSNARFMVMQRLSRKTESKVVVLRNMVTPEDVDEDLEDEVTSECSKYGSVDKVVIYQERQGIEEDASVIVKIFVVFLKPSEAENTCKALDGRWFGGQVIKAELYDQAKFDSSDLSH